MSNSHYSTLSIQPTEPNGIAETLWKKGVYLGKRQDVEHTLLSPIKLMDFMWKSINTRNTK